MQQEAYDERTKKFVAFGNDRNLGPLAAEEASLFFEHWFGYWEKSVLFAHLKGRRLYERVETLADVFLLTALISVVEAGLRLPFRSTIVAAVVGYYVAAAVFGVAHMALHAMVLDYHWSASPTAFFHFAYLHHRTKDNHIFQGQLLIMLFPSTRSNGSMLYEYLKYAVLVALGGIHRHTRLLAGWFFVSWIIEAAAHHHAHHHGPKLPPVTRAVLRIYDVLGLVPSPVSHKKHHDTSHPTRFTNFTDLSTPFLDKILNAIWDRVYKAKYHRGQIHETLSISDSNLVRALNLIGFTAAFLVARSFGRIDAAPFFVWMCLFTHILLVKPLRRVIVNALTFFNL